MYTHATGVYFFSVSHSFNLVSRTTIVHSLTLVELRGHKGQTPHSKLSSEEAIMAAELLATFHGLGAAYLFKKALSVSELYPQLFRDKHEYIVRLFDEVQLTFARQVHARMPFNPFFFLSICQCVYRYFDSQDILASTLFRNFQCTIIQIKKVLHRIKVTSNFHCKFSGTEYFHTRAHYRTSFMQ